VGHHYNPQRLLRNFEDPNNPGYIWQHDRQRDTPVSAAIKRVAQERDFYDPLTEKLLNTQVEIPGGDAIDKILTKQPLTREEFVDLLNHVGTMLRRDPFYRQWAKEVSCHIMPKAMEMVREHGRNHVRKLAQVIQLSEKWVNAWLEQMEQSIERLDGRASEIAIERMNYPFPSEIILNALLDMTWRIVESTGPQFFITSDNPAVYFRAEGYSLGGEDTEVVMPISTAEALHGRGIGSIRILAT
jgi:Protein of unknown function (DUF4238)